MATKHCMHCETDRPVDDFYKGRNLCRSCHNRWYIPVRPEERKKRATKWDLMSEENRKAISDAVKAGEPVRDIAKRHNVNYCSIYNWIKHGKL